MDHVLSSARLTLSPFDTSDLDIAIEMFTDPAVRRFTGGAISEDQIREQLPNWTKRGGNGCIGIWCISDRETSEKLGTVALLPLPIEEDETDFDQLVIGQMPDGDVEVGYFLKQSAWGKGYATEACKRILQFAFEESPLPEIVATFDAGNDASRNVLKKAGFTDKGMRRCYGEESIDFRITKEEWSGKTVATIT